MRIWCQSTGAHGKDKMWDPYGQSLRRHLERVVRPGTVVELHGTDATIPGVGGYRAPGPMIESQAVRNAMRAEEQGYDAFVQISTIDGGYHETREVVDIPVLFSTETCLHMASLLSDKSAFFTHNLTMLNRMTELAEKYGMAHRLGPGGHLNLMGYAEIMDIFRNPDRYKESVISAAREIGARGANMLIPAALPLSQWLLDNGIRDVEGVAIMDVTGTTIKMAELMVDLKGIGIKRSPRYYSRPPADVLAALKKAYGV